MYAGKIAELKPIDMKTFDTMNATKVAEKLLETIKEPRRRQILQNFIDHARAEALGDYDALMASCSRKWQTYGQWGGSEAMAAHQPQSYAELEIHYKNLIDLNIFCLHLNIDKLTVGDDTLALDGVIHQLYPGAFLEPAFGFKPDHPEGVYQMTTRVCTFFVFDEDGLGAGEQSYTPFPISKKMFTLVPTEEVPELFWQRAEKPVAV